MSRIVSAKPENVVSIAPRERRAGVTVSDVHRRLKDMVIVFDIRPGERVNEGALAEQLGVSRTPLREALHRLVAENMLDMVPNRGFYGRRIERQEVFDLYELRKGLELTAINLALVRARDEDISDLRRVWMDVIDRVPHMPIQQLVAEDENFHLLMARLSGNQELVNALQAINGRIHHFRWSDLEKKGEALGDDHLALIDALLKRDGVMCRELIDAHISHRMEEIVQFIQSSVVRIYAPEAKPVSPPTF